MPNFQRPYSWDTEQLEDFWSDVVLAHGDFFFGSTVTWVSSVRDLFNDTYSIIDGQQRLTTSAIFLSVVRDAFTKIASDASEVSPDVAQAAKSQADATQKYLITTDDDGKAYPVLTRSEAMFYEQIQNPNAIPSGHKWNGSAERIGAARVFFETRVLAELSSGGHDQQLERLKAIRANVLKARVIQVELASEEDGFLIFETLNTRGADLRLADLAKNLLIRGAATALPDRDAIAVRWDRIVDRVQNGRLDSDVVDRFIWQSWNSRRDAVKAPELFKEIGRLVGSDPVKHIEYLEELETDSLIYQYLEDDDVRVQAKVSGVRNAMAVAQYVDSVRALAIFNVSVANSTAIAIARKYQETKLVSEAQLVDVMRLVESFHFQFTSLTNGGSTGGTRGRYNRFAVRLEKASTKAEVVDAIKDFADKLRASLPAREAAMRAFEQLFYAPNLRLTQAQKIRGRKIFISYVLMSFAKWKRLLPPGQSLSSWSIEHIKPQSLAADDPKDPTYSIGNLTLLTEALNSELGNADLQTKMKSLKKGSAYFDANLESWSGSGVLVPSDDQLAQRASTLAAEAVDSVWNL
ncbi:DUF262 domain-containing protein [Microbacterium sp. NPDC058345]|uniref:DUF262 domain-containing protein n=1 Tax=Microbacterium sp. NPDC058345 TaxID=3346455 RepID=UPI00365D57D6